VIGNRIEIVAPLIANRVRFVLEVNKFVVFFRYLDQHRDRESLGFSAVIIAPAVRVRGDVA